MIIKKLNAISHRHNKWLFGVLTLLIIISFVGFLAPGQFGLDMFRDPANQTVGVAFGEKVTLGELRDQARRLSIAPEILYGVSSRDMNLEQSFGAVCMLRAAKQMGLTVSDGEIAKVIASLPRFQTSGKFDLAKYKSMLEMLQRQGVSEDEVTQSLREAILLFGKLERELGAGVIVTPNEAKAFFRLENSSYTLNAAKFDAKSFEKTVKATGDGLKKYFAKNQANYMIPGKISGLVAVLDYASVKTKNVPDAELEKFFRRNPMAYAAKDAKKAPEFKSVKEAVRKAFHAEAVRDVAGRRAYAFTTAVFDKFNENEKNPPAMFRKLASQFGMKVIDLGTVDFGTKSAKGIHSADLFAQLEKVASSNPVTNVVLADKAAYVGLRTMRKESTPAKLDEVKTKAFLDYRRSLAVEAARKAAEKASADLGKTDAAKREAAFKKLTNCTFAKVEIGPEKSPAPEFAVLSYPAMHLAKGEVSAAVPTENGALIAYMEKRVAPSDKEFSTKQALYESQLRAFKRAMAAQSLQQRMAAECRMNPELLRDRN